MRNNAVVAIEETNIVYLTDTDEGASGAPVTNDNWQVIAVHRAVQYQTLFPAMIRNWRQDWEQRSARGDFPFLFVQLAPFMKIE